MIEILIVIGLGILTGRVIHLIKSRRLNTTNWLKLRHAVFVRLSRYNGYSDYKRVKLLVATLGFFCEQIAACTHIVQAREAVFYARNVTAILMELHGLGFFEKTRHAENHQ